MAKYTTEEYETYLKIKRIKCAEDLSFIVKDMGVTLTEAESDLLVGRYVDQHRYDNDLSYTAQLRSLVEELLDDKTPKVYIAEEDKELIMTNLQIADFITQGDQAISILPFMSLSKTTRDNLLRAANVNSEAEIPTSACVIFTWNDLYGTGFYITTGKDEANKYEWKEGADINDIVMRDIWAELPNLYKKTIDALYDTYRLDWMIAHGFTLMDFVELMARADNILRENDEYPEGNTMDIYEEIGTMALVNRSESFMFEGRKKWADRTAFHEKLSSDSYFLMKYAQMTHNLPVGIDIGWNRFRFGDGKVS